MMSRITYNVSLLLLAVFLVLFFYRPIETGDVWWHLSTGRWIAENGSVPDHDVFNITSRKIPWVPTSWLGSWIFYKVYEVGDYAGLKLFRLLIFLSIFGFFTARCFRRIPLALFILLNILIAYSLDYRVLMRPFIFKSRLEFPAHARG